MFHLKTNRQKLEKYHVNGSQTRMPLGIFCGCKALFVTNIVGNPEDRFSHNDAHMGLVMRRPVFGISENRAADQRI